MEEEKKTTNVETSEKTSQIFKTTERRTYYNKVHLYMQYIYTCISHFFLNKTVCGQLFEMRSDFSICYVGWITGTRRSMNKL